MTQFGWGVDRNEEFNKRVPESLPKKAAAVLDPIGKELKD